MEHNTFTKDSYLEECFELRANGMRMNMTYEEWVDLRVMQSELFGRLLAERDARNQDYPG